MALGILHSIKSSGGVVLHRDHLGILSSANLEICVSHLYDEKNSLPWHRTIPNNPDQARARMPRRRLSLRCKTYPSVTARPSPMQIFPHLMLHIGPPALADACMNSYLEPSRTLRQSAPDEPPKYHRRPCRAGRSQFLLQDRSAIRGDARNVKGLSVQILDYPLAEHGYHRRGTEQRLEPFPVSRRKHPSTS